MGTEQRIPEDHTANPFVFLVGCPRSGTTLLQRMVNAHSRIAITPESQWLPRFYAKRTGLTPDGWVTGELVARLLEHGRFCQLGLSRVELERLLSGAGQLSYARFVSAILDLYGKLTSKPFVGDKTPGYVRKIRILHELWPAAKFVHLIRDGRDVCLSSINWQRKAARMAGLYPTWSDEPVLSAAWWWTDHVRRGRQRGLPLGPGLYFELRYEALVSNPANECARLCSFLGVEFEETMLLFHQGRTIAQPGLSPKHAWLPITPGLRDWRTQMPKEDVERFEAAAGDLLDELGYARAVLQPSACALATAARVRAILDRKRVRQVSVSESSHSGRLSP
jgi:hypothetical protein